MRRVLTLYGTTVGKKVVMAVTGILLVGYVLGHMLGNLKLYLGPEKLDHYARFLRVVGDPFLAEGQFLWIARAVLLLAVGLHAHAAVSLKRLSMAARPIGYRRTAYEESTAASRTMIVGGVLIALFVIYHILHFTTGHVHPDFQHGRVYHNVVSGLSVWWVAAFYIVAMIALALHLYHGVWSMLQTLGVNHARYNHWRRRLAIALTLIVTIGNVSIPIAVLTAAVREHPVQEAATETPAP